MDLATATNQLYDADPADFVSLRTSLVKQAKAAGERDLAAQVQALRRPTVAAWYVNLLVRSGDPALTALLDLGVTMRAHQAQFDVAAINELTPQRRALETQTMANLDELLAARHTSASAGSLDEVRNTINAAISDERADAVVRTGTLVRSLSYAGFGVDLEGAAMTLPPPRLRLVRDGETPQHSEPTPDAAPSAPQSTPSEAADSEPVPGNAGLATSSSPAPAAKRATPRNRDREQRRALAQRQVKAATRAVEQAEQRLQAAKAARAEARATLREAQQRLDALTDQDARD